MKKITAIMLATLLIITLIPIHSFASHEKGLLHNRTPTFSTYVSNPQNAVDGFHNSFARQQQNPAGQRFRFDFPETTIESFVFDVITNTSFGAYFKVVYSDGTIDSRSFGFVSGNNSSRNGNVIMFPEPLENVVAVYIQTIDTSIYEWEIYELSETELTHSYDLTGITERATDTQINDFINSHDYVLPLNKDGQLSVYGSNVPIRYELNDSTGGLGYRFIVRDITHTLQPPGHTSTTTVATHNNLETTSIFTTEIGEPNTSGIYYTYPVSEPEPDPTDITPPSEVTNLTHTIEDGKAILSFTNPPEEDFYRVKIYRDDVLHGYSTTETFYR